MAVLKGARSRRPRGHHGQSLVEFALFAPLLAVIILGAGDLGRVFYYSIEVTNAAREGARHGAYFDPVSSTDKYDSASAIFSTVTAEDNWTGGSLTLKTGCPGAGAPYGGPYAASYYPSGPGTDNTGYVYVCFNNASANTTSNPGQPIRVVTLYSFAPMTPVIWNFLGNNGRILVAGSAEFIVEGL